MKRIIALVSVYYPNEIVVDNISRIGRQVDEVIICDNSPNMNSLMFQKVTNVNYVAYNQNEGLPRAFNKAINKYNFNDEDFLVFFDQDSRIDDNYIVNLLDEYEIVENKFPQLGCMGPIFYNTSNNKTEVPHFKTRLCSSSYRVENIITSSLLTRYGNLAKVGFWNDNLFLDFVDWDLCWRFEQVGLICAITEKVLLNHTVGIGEKKVGPIHLRVGQPFREYYQTRDALFLLNEYYVPLKMRLRLIANVTVRPLVHFIFLDNKYQRMNYIKRGWQDYKNGIKGEYKA